MPFRERGRNGTSRTSALAEGTHPEWAVKTRRSTPPEASSNRRDIGETCKDVFRMSRQDFPGGFFNVPGLAGGASRHAVQMPCGSARTPVSSHDGRQPTATRNGRGPKLTNAGNPRPGRDRVADSRQVDGRVICRRRVPVVVVVVRAREGAPRSPLALVSARLRP